MADQRIFGEMPGDPDEILWTPDKFYNLPDALRRALEIGGYAVRGVYAIQVQGETLHFLWYSKSVKRWYHSMKMLDYADCTENDWQVLTELPSPTEKESK